MGAARASVAQHRVVTQWSVCICHPPSHDPANHKCGCIREAGDDSGPESAASRKGDCHPFTNTGRALSSVSCVSAVQFKSRSPGIHRHTGTYEHTHCPSLGAAQCGEKSKTVMWALWTGGCLFGFSDHSSPLAKIPRRCLRQDRRQEKGKAPCFNSDLLHLLTDTQET